MLWPSRLLPITAPRASCNKAPSPGWSRNLAVSSEVYPGTDEELEVKGPSQAGNSWAQLRNGIKSPLPKAPSFRRRRIYRRDLEGGQGRLQRAALGVGTSVGRGGREAAQLLRGGCPEPGCLQKCPRALGTAGNRANTQTASVLPAGTWRKEHTSQSTYCVWQARRCGLAGCYLGQSETASGSKAPLFPACAGLKPPPLRALLAFKFSPVLGLFV